MRTNEIVANIESNGGFSNWHNWNKKEIAEWVFNNFPCSRYVAKNVAYRIG